MKRFAKLFAATLGFGVLGFLMSLVPQKTAQGVTPEPVQVTNTPLPVKGDITATITGSPAVKVLNNVPVINGVSSGKPIPLTVQTQEDSPATPFQVNLCASNASCKLGTLSVPATFDEPGDERLVIEYVSGECQMVIQSSNLPMTVSLGINTTVGGTTVTHYFATIPEGISDNISASGFSNRTRLYADPSKTVTLGDVPYGTTSSTCVIGVSGYLMPK